MKLIVISESDPASTNIRERLLEFGDWSKDNKLKFDDKPVYFYKQLALIINISEYHLYFDNIDKHLINDLDSQGFKLDLENVIFASKHRSASGMKTLTLHPMGNYGSEAKFGGKPEELVKTAPQIMTEGYRRLLENASKYFGEKLEHSISFEVTHHGPILDTPSFFIEIGSDESAWGDELAARVIAQTIMDLLAPGLDDRLKQYPVAIGVGGGHYAPRHSDVARKKQVSFGHMIPNYALDNISDKMLVMALERTPGAEYIYFHKKALKKPRYRELKTFFIDNGCKVVKSDDLEDL
jgi:D-aminoacyl-tRNA deacylase